MVAAYFALAITAVAFMLIASSVRVINQYERGVVYRFGRVRPAIRGPGLAVIAPVIDRLQKVDMQILTMPVPPRMASPATTSR